MVVVKNILFSLFGLLFVFLASSGFSQTIKGVVLDSTEMEVPFASVGVFNSSDSNLVKLAVTDTAGAFSTDVSIGEYYLKISAIGFEDYYSETIAITDTNMILSKTWTIGSSAIELEGATITYEKPMVENTA